MGWDATNKVLTLPFTKIAANGQGDLQLALGRSVKSEIQLIKDVDSSNNYVNAINKWAKYKPVKNTAITYASDLDSNLQWKPTATWWKAHDGQCGMVFATYQQLYVSNNPWADNSFLRKLKDGDLPWTYDHPPGTSTYPLRAYDFNQYYHEAPKPVTGVFDNLRLVASGTTYNLTVQLDETRAQNDLGLQLDDLVIGNSAVSGWYVGILIYKSDSLYTFGFTANTLGTSGDLTVEFTGLTASYAGSAIIVPFLASKRANQGLDPGAGTYLSCDVLPQTVTIQAAVQGVVTDITAQWKDSLYGRVGYSVNVINNTTSPITANNMVIALYDGSQNIATRNVGNITVAARDNNTYSGTFAVQNYDPSKTYSVVVTSSNSSVSGSYVVDAPRT